MVTSTLQLESLLSKLGSTEFALAATIDPTILAEGEALLDDLAIDLSARLSRRPGVYGHPGASPKQIALHDAFHAHTHRIYAASGANQSGKTQAVAGLCFCKHLRDVANDGEIYWVIARSSETCRDIPQRSLWSFLPKGMFPENVKYEPKLGFGSISTLHLKLPGGRGRCEVWFKTEEQDLVSFESARLNGIWWTECTRESLFDALFPRLAARSGWMLMDFVPTEAWHKFRIKLPAEAPTSDIYHVRFCMRDNAHNLKPGEIEFQSRSMTPEQRAIRIDGEDGAAQGIVFKEFDPKKHVIPAFPIPASWPRWRAMDYGYRNPTACLWCTVAPAGFNGWTQERLIVYRELYRSEFTVKANADEINTLSAGERFQRPVIIDPTAYNRTQANGASIAEEYMKAGLPMTRGVATAAVGEHALIARVRKCMEADLLYVFGTCPNLSRELQSWRYVERKDGAIPGAEPFEDANNHAIDALKYWIATNPVHSQSSRASVTQGED
jgi:hypothetical protein